MSYWISFYNIQTGEELASIAIENEFKGVINETIELLAYENGIDELEIGVKPKY